MGVINPEDYGPPITEIDAIFRKHVAMISKTLGEIAFPINAVLLRREFIWSVVWFVDDKNNNLQVGLIRGNLIKVEIISSKDPTTLLFFVHSTEKLDELLQRFTPDHWRETSGSDS